MTFPKLRTPWQRCEREFLKLNSSIDELRAPPHRLWRSEFVLLTLPTAAILVTLGALKLVDAANASSLQFAIAAAEIGCGLGLVCARRAAFVQVGFLSLASAFVGASLVGLATNRNCDCFGNLDVAPLDRFLLAALLLVSALMHIAAPLRFALSGMIAGGGLLLGAAGACSAFEN